MDELKLFTTPARSRRISTVFSDSDDSFVTPRKKKKIPRVSKTESSIRRGGLPSLQLDMRISGTRLVPESLSYVRPVRCSRFVEKQKDYKTLPIEPGTATKYNYNKYHNRGSSLSQNYDYISPKHIQTLKRGLKRLQNEETMIKTVDSKIPKWAEVGFSTTHVGSKKYKIKSKYAKVNKI